MSADEIGGFFWIIVCSFVIGGGLGFVIGKTRGQENNGLLLGFLLGPLGWIITLLLEDKRIKCPECRGPLEADVKRCRHCGVILIPEKVKKASDIVLDMRALEAGNELIPKRQASFDKRLGIKPKQFKPVGPTVNCPVCGDSIAAALLKDGENQCPTCGEVFPVEIET